MKKFILLLPLFLLAVAFVNAEAINYTALYNNGTYYLQDGSNDTDLTISGAIASQSLNIFTSGWQNLDACVGAHEYNNGHKFTGSYSIQMDSGCIATMYVKNTTYSGMVAWEFYDHLDDPAPNVYAVYGWDNGGSGVKWALGIRNAGNCNNAVYCYFNGTNWYPIDGVARSLGWHRMMVNATSTKVGIIYVDNISRASYVSANDGLDKVTLYSGAGEGWYDRVFLTRVGYVQYNVETPYSPPTGIPVLNYTNGTHFNYKITFNISEVLDPDSEGINYETWANFNFTGYVLKQNTTNTTYVTNWSNNGIYCYRINTTDGKTYGNSSATYCYVYDTISPTITITNPKNSTWYSSGRDVNLPISVTCIDASGIYTHYWNITNTSGKYVNSQTFTNISGYPIIHTITNNTLPLSAFPDGNFTFNDYCADIHTTNTIENFVVDKNIVAESLGYATKGNYVSIKLVSSDNVLKDFSTIKEIDRYSFNYNYNNDGKSHTYTYRLSANEKITYLMASKYKGHFITGNNWVTFDMDTKADVKYSIVFLDEYNVNVQITTAEANMKFRSIGELNINRAVNYFGVDNTYPNVIFTYPTLANEANVSQQVINIYVNATDPNFANLTYKLETGDVYTTATDYNHSFTALQYGWHYYNVTLCDLGGNCNTTLTRSVYLQSPTVAEKIIILNTCPSGIAGVLMFALIVAIALGLFVIALKFRVGVMGLLGGIVMLVAGMIVWDCIDVLGLLFIATGLIIGLVSVFSIRFIK